MNATNAGTPFTAIRIRLSDAAVSMLSAIKLPNIGTVDPGDGENTLWMDPITRVLKVGT
jgi:hypothetical protein